MSISGNGFDRPNGDGDDWQKVSRRYYRGPGGWWWLALLLVPALLAFAALGLESDNDGDSDAVTASAGTDAQTAGGAPSAFSLVKGADGKSVTVTADVPDVKTKTGLLDSVTKAAGPGVQVVDKVIVAKGSSAPTAETTAALLPAGKDVKDFSASWDPDNLTLTGEAANEQIKAAAAASAEAAVKDWKPKATVDNQIKVVAPSPAPPADAACASVGQKVASITTRTRILFVEGSPDLAPQSQAALDQVAQLLKSCGTAKVVVAGNTDNQGSDATSKPLSQRRADAVKAMLVKAGVKAANISTTANGSAKPIASNDTDAGRNVNRRVDITVK